MKTEILKEAQLRNENLKMDTFISTEIGFVFLKAASMSKYFH